MRLQKVVSRKPVGHRPHPEQCPEYIVCYCVETLACGHTITSHYNPPVERLVAQRRDCKVCGSQVLEFPSSQRKLRSEDSKAA